MSAAKDVNIFNKDGSVTVYKKLSERLPDFLEKYPVGEGYRLLSSSQEYLSATPALSKIAEMLVTSGTKLDDLQKLISLTSRIFTCELRDESNEVVASASSLKKIAQYKDYETGETAALQRLLAKLGFGGEIFDEDEQSDFNDQELTTRSVKGEETVTTSVKATVAQITPEPKPAVEIVQETSTNNILENACNVAPALMRQLKRQAEIAGIACPHVTSSAEAKAALKKIKNN